MYLVETSMSLALMHGKFSVVPEQKQNVNRDSGTGRTLPFACNLVNKTATALSKRATNFTIPQLDMYPLLISKLWDDARSFVDACANTEGNKEIAGLMGTPFVARDMLNIVDALAEDGLLRFWGRSYSTVLGQTFAAMFPDRVGRILLDSTLRFDDYYSGQWNTATRGTEASLRNFFTECIKASPSICPLANFTGSSTTADTLMTELDSALQDLIDHPVMMPADYAPPGQPWWQPGITLYQTIKYALLTLTYRPDQFISLYSIVELTLHRNWTALAQVSPMPPSNTTELPWSLGFNAFHGIGCSDTANRAKNPEDLYSVIRAQGAGGSWGDVFAPQVWVCAQWPFRAKEQFEGPFAGIKTNHPILLVSGAFDPITPVSGAWEAAANLEGSRVVVHNGQGHGLMNHPSACTIRAIHDYFNDGTLPEVGTVCEPDQPAFELALEAAGLSEDGGAR
jgi:pimeloyl-ACP methyl ester carboxylesterase